jgi:oligopeptide/dipeptide ABC transporter ATP-binding protein
MSAVPVPDPSGGKRQRQLLSGDVPSPANPPQACRFHTRCPKAQAICSTEEPVLEDKGSGSRAACHFPLTSDEVSRLLPAALAGHASSADASGDGEVAGPTIPGPASSSSSSST